MPRIPVEVSALLDSLAAELPRILRANLIGVYLYGSLTQGAFDPARSDVDCIVVTRRALSASQFKRLRAWLRRSQQSNPWTSRLQASFLVKGKLLTANSPY